LCSNSLFHRLKIQRDELNDIQEIIKFHCPEFEEKNVQGDLVREIEDYMSTIKNDIKNNFDTWKVDLEQQLLGDNYKNKMERRIIDNEEIIDKFNNFKVEEGIKIKSTFDGTIMRFLGETIQWKRFGEFSLPNMASLI